MQPAPGFPHRTAAPQLFGPAATGEKKQTGRPFASLFSLSAVKAGIGVAPLPTTLGDAEETLVQVLPAVEELTRSWYLLSHPDLRKTPRIAAFIDHMLGDIPALKTR